MDGRKNKTDKNISTSIARGGEGAFAPPKPNWFVLNSWLRH